MDAKNKQHRNFIYKLARCVGLYQMLNPDSITIYGYNVYHIVSTVLLCVFISVMILYLITLYSALHDIDEFMNVLLVTMTFWGSIYKSWIILRNSRKIWDCFNVTKLDILSYQRYDRDIFKNWSRRSMRLSYVFVVVLTLGTIFWALNPLIFQNTYIVSQNIDGSFNRYRMNINNLNFMVSDITYNKYFYVYYFIEIIIFSIFLWNLIMAYLIMTTLCHAYCSQLETICEGIESLGHSQESSDNVIGNISN